MLPEGEFLLAGLVAGEILLFKGLIGLRNHLRCHFVGKYFSHLQLDDRNWILSDMKVTELLDFLMVSKWVSEEPNW